jgi:SAM-dependent methyltransferase
VNFDVAAEAYDRFMGRYSIQLSAPLADFAEIRAGNRVVDVGCGPGAMTAELVRRVGPGSVSAVDPSRSFVAAARARNPGIDAVVASAENLPFPDRAFDAALAQLVVHFMHDPIAGLREMSRITRRDGLVAASVWDHGTGRGPLSLFWRAALEVDPNADDESELPGARRGHLAGLFRAAELQEVEETELASSVEYASFDEWWEPYTRGVGTAGTYLAALTPDRQQAVRDRCQALLPNGPFVIDAWAWAVRGRAS